ncbi:hypothetical protein [Veillonella sp.]|uniref:hypothetical protein n=1 Tax=Veillonella sp. TaxID=1926307 RepID=UPI0029153641|nr:hypothetical protein [Veillonella sp.]MDU5246045.1 hypothetical protein [Veillonella sp.]
MNRKNIIWETTVNTDFFRNHKNLQICIMGDLVEDQINNPDFIDNNNEIELHEVLENKHIIEEKNIEIENLNKRITDERTKYEDLLEEKNQSHADFEQYKKDTEFKLSKQSKDINKLEKEKKELENNIIRCESDSNALKKQYENEVKVLNESIASLSDELNSLFKNNREIYDKVMGLDTKYLNELVKPINLDDFETFLISSVSSGDALRRIWSVAKIAIKSNDITAYEILWKYFEEMVKLHNKFKGEEIFSIDTVNIGDTYSVHDHESKDETISFGHVSKIYILGFTNKLQGKKIEKSYVLVKG